MQNEVASTRRSPHPGERAVRNRAIVLISDEPFLIATLRAAVQALEQPGVIENADVLIYLTMIAHDLVSEIRAAFDHLPIQFHVLDPRIFELPSSVHFNKTHVPPTTLARLSLDQFIPFQYEHILYLDGDIQIVGDLLPLINYNVAPGRIAAASEAAWIYQGEVGRYWKFMRGYLNGLGISNPRDYFNAGVLAFRRDTWAEKAPVAKEFFLRHSELCTYHDQSALNAVFLGRRDLLSPRWNFVAGYANNSSTDLSELRVIHFTGAEKPWRFSGPPWHGRFMSSYIELVKSYPALEPLAQRYLRPPGLNAYNGAGQYRLAFRPAPPWRPALRSRRIKQYLAQTPFDLP